MFKRRKGTWQGKVPWRWQVWDLPKLTKIDRPCNCSGHACANNYVRKIYIYKHIIFWQIVIYIYNHTLIYINICVMYIKHFHEETRPPTLISHRYWLSFLLSVLPMCIQHLQQRLRVHPKWHLLTRDQRPLPDFWRENLPMDELFTTLVVSFLPSCSSDLKIYYKILDALKDSKSTSIYVCGAVPVSHVSNMWSFAFSRLSSILVTGDLDNTTFPYIPNNQNRWEKKKKKHVDIIMVELSQTWCIEWSKTCLSSHLWRWVHGSILRKFHHKFVIRMFWIWSCSRSMMYTNMD